MKVASLVFLFAPKIVPHYLSQCSLNPSCKGSSIDESLGAGHPKLVLACIFVSCGFL